MAKGDNKPQADETKDAGELSAAVERAEKAEGDLSAANTATGDAVASAETTEGNLAAANTAANEAASSSPRT